VGFVKFHHSGTCRPLLAPRKTDHLYCVGHFPSRIRETVLVRATCRRKLLDRFRLISCWFLRVTWLNTSAFSFYLIPLGLKKLLGKGSHDVSHRGVCYFVTIDLGVYYPALYHRATHGRVREASRRPYTSERHHRCVPPIICIYETHP